MKAFRGLLVILLLPLAGYSQLTVSGALTPQQLVQQVLLGPGATVSNINYTGHVDAIGSFNGTASNIGLAAGVLLTTGDINIAPGPNNLPGDGVDHSLPGDTLLSTLSGGATFDAADLEFDFQSSNDTLRFRYVFASEEYNEYVCASKNDIFGFFISGPGIVGEQNIALIPGTTVPVAINTVNNGAVAACSPPVSGLFVNNPQSSLTTVQYDGFTTVLTAQAIVTPCVLYHIRLVIADGGDGVFDSGVFLEAGSFNSVAPVQSIAQVPPIGCMPYTVSFQNQSIGTNRFSWNFGDGTADDTTINPVHTFYLPGVYSVQLIAIDTSICSYPDTSWITVQVDSGHVDAAMNLWTTGVCDAITASMGATGTGAQVYEWQFGDGVSTHGLSVAHTYNQPGNYTLVQIAHDTICNTSDTAWAQVQLRPRIYSRPAANIYDGCEPLAVSFCDSGLAQPGSTYSWDFGNGDISDKQCDSMVYTAPGPYQVRLVVGDTASCNGTDTAFLSVNVRVTPDAGMLIPDSQNVLFPLAFVNSTVNGVSWSWDFGDGNTSSLETPTHLYGDTGLFTVCIEALNDECYDTACSDIVLYKLLQNLWFPAAFTPNGDGVNDIFALQGVGLASLHFLILNRWGDVVFEGTSLADTWDGTQKGSAAEQGVYVVVVKAVFLDQQTFERRGSITLYR